MAINDYDCSAHVSNQFFLCQFLSSQGYAFAPHAETTNIEFRTEIFNFTNTPPLGNPNTILGAAGFGTITTAGDPRVIQFGLKLNF